MSTNNSYKRIYKNSHFKETSTRGYFRACSFILVEIPFEKNKMVLCTVFAVIPFKKNKMVLCTVFAVIIEYHRE